MQKNKRRLPVRESGLSITLPSCLIDGSDAEFRHLVNGLLPFAARLLSVRDGLGNLIGLTGIQYSVLMSISHLSQKEPVTVNLLADHLHLSGAFITIETGKLKKLGLIGKVRDPDDKRKMRLSLSEDGRKLLDGLLLSQQHVNDVLFDGITRSEFRTLCAVIDRLVANGDRATLDVTHLLARLNSA